MSLLSDATRALLGISTYQAPPPSAALDIEAPQVVRTRKAWNGQLVPLPQTKLRWYLADLEMAQANADVGNLLRVGQLHHAMQRDGVISGLLGTLSSGLVRLPKRFYGNEAIANDLRANNGTRSVFDDMFPPAELAHLVVDGYSMGVGVAELMPVVGRDFPVMVRLDPRWLQYRWNENRWYYLSIAGPLAITPGDGRWILHTPGGRVAPWNSAKWPALGRSYINKEHAMLHRSNFSAKLANPARVAVAPNGAGEEQRKGFFQRLLAWGVNTVFELPNGWDVRLLESNGRGYEVFKDEIITSDNEIMVTIAGQVVTVTGGTGFANADIHKTIREDIIQDVAETLAYTINTQGIPPWAFQKYGMQALTNGALAAWNTERPADMKDAADTLLKGAQALAGWNSALIPYDKRVAVPEITTRFGVPIENGPIPQPSGAPEVKPQVAAPDSAA